jgi:hypothetical protein
MRDALCDVQMAMRANPDFVIIGSSAGGGLNVVLDTVFDFGALNAGANGIEI